MSTFEAIRLLWNWREWHLPYRRDSVFCDQVKHISRDLHFWADSGFVVYTEASLEMYRPTPRMHPLIHWLMKRCYTKLWMSETQ